MQHLKLIHEIVIPNYIRQVTLSKSQRPTFFEWNGKTIKGKKKNIFKKLFPKKNFCIKKWN